MSDEDLIDAWAPPRGPGPSAPIDALQAAHDELNALLGVHGWARMLVGSREGRPDIRLLWTGADGRPTEAHGSTLGEVVAKVRAAVSP